MPAKRPGKVAKGPAQGGPGRSPATRTNTVTHNKTRNRPEQESSESQDESDDVEEKLDDGTGADEEDEDDTTDTDEIDDNSEGDSLGEDEASGEEDMTDSGESFDHVDESTDDESSDEFDLDEHELVDQKEPKDKRKAFGDAISHILQDEAGVLSGSKRVKKEQIKEKQSNLEWRARKSINASRRQVTERCRVVNPLADEESAASVLEREKGLRKTAQRGVIQLFNHIKAFEAAKKEAAEPPVKREGKQTIPLYYAN